MKQFVPYSPQPAAEPPRNHLVESLICDGCESEIEGGAGHIVHSDCTAVPSKKNPNVMVSEYSADRPPELVFHDRECAVRYYLDKMWEEGDEALDGVVEYAAGGPTILCLCTNCGGELENLPEPLCDHCEGKMA